MMKKSVFVAALTGLCSTSLLVGAITYAAVRMDEPTRIDLSAFRNASANIQHLTQTIEIKPAKPIADVTGSIVNTIEGEVRAKILRTRYAITSTTKQVQIKPVEIAKNWSDIKPEFAAVDLKLDEVTLKKVTASEEASEFEINNKELINLYGFEVAELQYESFANIEIGSIEGSEVAEVTEAPKDLKSDEVKVAQASTTTQVVEEITPETPNDDLVVYDYSANEKAAETSKPKKMFDAPISNSVKEVIEREVHKSPMAANRVSTQEKKIESIDAAELEKVMNDEDNLVFDYSKESLAAVAKKETSESAASAFTTNTRDTATQVEFTIKGLEVNLSTQKVRPAVGYEFVPDYDRAERTDDQASGEIKLGYSLAGDVSTQTGVVQSQGLIPTRVELNLLNKGMNIPLLNEGGIQKFLSKKAADVEGNLLMVAVDPSIVDVEIDSEYKFKVFFSSKFKLLESQTNASYVLFLGVKTGNISLRYLLANKESAQKIIYVGDGEMYFEDPDFVGTQREQYTLTTRSLLGKKVKELSIDGTHITFFGSKTSAKKKALNVYEIKVPELVGNSRKYLEFKHMNSSLFVGTTSATEIEIPGQDFIGKVLQANDLSELGERCLVQINLTKDLRDIKVNGKNSAGEMFTETSFLDNDGNFSRDNLELSEKVFVTGDLEGMFNVRLDYTDGSSDFLKTFCSEGSYLIEQL